MQKRWWYSRLWYLLFLIPLLYRPILGIFLIFLLPGLGFVFNLFKNTKIHEKIALSIALSIALVVLNGFFLNMTFGLSFATVFTSLLLITLIPLFIYFKKQGFELLNLKFKKPSKEQIFRIILLIFCLLVLAVKVYKPHFENPYPIHLDEWSRLLETTHIIEEETFNNGFNPQFVGHPDAPRRLNPGFQFILSQFYIVSGVDHITFFQYLPALFAVMTGFILFSLLYKISSYWTGVFGIIFLSFMKTNDNTLGIAYLIALTMTFPLLYGMFYSLHNAFEKKKSIYFLLASFIYFTILVTHEQTGAAFMPIILAYVIISTVLLAVRDKEDIHFSKKGIFIAIISVIIPLSSLYVARDIIWKGTFMKSFHFLLDLIVWDGTSSITYSYNFVLFYGFALTILAILGTIMIFKNINMGVFIIWSLIAVGQVVNFYFNQVTYFSAIARIRHHAVLGLIPLSAYGLYSLLDSLSKLIKEHRDIIFTVISTVIILTATIISLNYVDKGKYLPEDKMPKHGLVITPTIDYKDYQAILFLKNISYKQVVLASPLTSAAISPISKNYIVASAQNSVDGFGGGNIQAVKKFFSMPSCINKQNIVYRNNIRYVLSTKPINCPFLKQVYSEDFRYIYKAE